jgi:hypothetical protein
VTNLILVRILRASAALVDRYMLTQPEPLVPESDPLPEPGPIPPPGPEPLPPPQPEANPAPDHSDVPEEISIQ